MLNRKQLLRFMIETVLLSAVSVIVMLLGIFATNSSEYARVQNSYMANFSNVLDADYASANLKTLNAAGLEAWLAYLRTHAVQ